MSTQPKPKLKICATYLGPILSLDAELTKYDQNLIFARNGTGKSFLSRAFRYLDSKNQNKDISDAVHNLISDESADGTGAFSFFRGIDVMGELQLAKQGKNVSANTNDTIFHVFSEDFVHDELRERSYEIYGKIENQISVDSENIKQKDAQEALEKAIVNEQTATSALCEEYDYAIVSVLHEKAGINKQLREYKSLSLDALLEHFDTKPNPPAQSFTEILKDLDSLKAIPAEPVYPVILNSIGNGDFDLAALESSLQKTTSPSSVSEEIKEDIDAHHSFYETGVKIIQDGDNLTCPLCKQGITSSDPKAVIDAYIAYFEDEEERHKSNLREFSQGLIQKETDLNDIEKRLTKQRSQYDALKRFVPSKKDTEMDEGETNLSKLLGIIASLKAVIQKKVDTLHLPHELPSDSLASHIANINKVIEDNNAKVSELNKAVGKSDEERKALQRKSCEVFTHEFAISNWANIDALIELRRDAKNKQLELAELEKSSPSTDARVRVADTFELLLKEFFANKYNFDKETFVLKRGEHEMLRGTHRTLSDGEKTAIAFCYFIACLHRKVTSNNDYRKLFLVFDDPVTSMSYDFVFSIAQTLKNLGISDNGEISINPSKIANNKCFRPELLILTHSSYFFNISRTNKVVKENATFSLSVDGTTHKLSPLSSYVAPFEQQLKHIYHVSNGTNDPDYSTGNAIRSVLEAVGRFCRPDKSQSLENFIVYLAGQQNFSIKSIMINSLCHGTYYNEAPSPDDLRLACQEAIAVVEYFAAGQIEIIKGL